MEKMMSCMLNTVISPKSFYHSIFDTRLAVGLLQPLSPVLVQAGSISLDRLHGLATQLQGGWLQGVQELLRHQLIDDGGLEPVTGLFRPFLAMPDAVVMSALSRPIRRLETATATAADHQPVMAALWLRCAEPPSSQGGSDAVGRVPDSPGNGPRSSKRTPTEVTPRRPSSDLPIIGLAALLSLVEWIEERRIKSQQGGPSCDDHQANVSPPAPDRAEGATTTGPALAGSDRRPAAANAPGAQPRRGSSTRGTAGRKRGGA